LANCSTLRGVFLNRNDADIRTFRTAYGQIETEFGFFRPLFAALELLRHLAAVIRHRLAGMDAPDAQNILRRS